MYAARLVQSVENETLNLGVVGSSPTLGETFFSIMIFVNLKGKMLFHTTLRHCFYFLKAIMLYRFQRVFSYTCILNMHFYMCDAFMQEWLCVR